MGIIDDLRFALRLARQNFAFSATVVLVLALGIGANTAIFSVVHSVLLRPLPYPDAERIVNVWNSELPERNDGNPLSPNEAIEYQERNRSFEHFAAYSIDSVSLTRSSGTTEVQAGLVTHAFFDVLGSLPLAGRTFRADEDRPGQDDVVVLGYGIWKSLGGEAALVGSRLRIDGRERTVLGVMPAGTDYPRGVDLWLPLAIDTSRLDRQTILSHGLGAIARLRPGISRAAAELAMDSTIQSLADRYPDHIDATHGAMVIPLHDSIVGNARPALVALLAAVGFLLLIACTNVANLQLSRIEKRQRELAIRGALGAGRARIVRQILIECAALAACAGVVALLFAYWTIDLLRTLIPATLPRVDQIAINTPVLAFTAVLSLLTGVIFGLAPALHATRGDLQLAMKENAHTTSGSPGSRRFRSGLVVAEVGLVLILLTGAGVMTKTLWRLLNVDSGMQPANVLTMAVSPPGSRYGEPRQIQDFYDGLLSRVQQLPGVESAAAISWLPLARRPSNWGIDVDPPLAIEDDEAVGPDYALISGDYFRALGIPLLRGRRFNDDDRAVNPGVIVTESAAARFWPGNDALGQRLRLSTDTVWRTVVGVVADHRNRSLRVEARPGLFLPHVQIYTGSPYIPRSMDLVLRSTDAPERLAGAVRGLVAEIDSEVPLGTPRTMEMVFDDDLTGARFIMRLLLLFSGIGLVLGVVGVYGVISLGVEQRSREFGVRRALGATTAHLLQLVLGGGLRLIALGVAIGVAGATLGLGRVIGSLLFEVEPWDPLVLLGVAALVATVGFAAGLFPALRASRVDPMTALRSE